MITANPATSRIVPGVINTALIPSNRFGRTESIQSPDKPNSTGMIIAVEINTRIARTTFLMDSPVEELRPIIKDKIENDFK